MLTIEADIFKQTEGIADSRYSKSHRLLIVHAWEQITTEWDFAGMSDNLYELLEKHSNRLLAYWKRAIDFGRNGDTSLEGEYLGFSEYDFEGPDDGRSVTVVTRSDLYRNEFKLTEVKRFGGTHCYDPIHPPVIASKIRTYSGDDLYDELYSIEFGLARRSNTGPFFITKFQGDVYKSDKDGRTGKDQRTLTIKL